MSLSELTRNAFQSGLSAAKWLSLCKLFIEKNSEHVPHSDVESYLSNSVLTLFRSYPGDPSLRDYLRVAIQDGTLSLNVFISTFLSTWVELEKASTLDMLCKLALDYQYSAQMESYLRPVLGQFSEQLTNVRKAMALLQMEYSSHSTQFHPVTNSASQLLLMILPHISDIAQRPRHELSMLYSNGQQLLDQGYRIPIEAKGMLEDYLLSLSVLLHDDKATQQAQAFHTLQLAIVKSDTGGGNSMSSDLIMCGLVLHALISRRANEFGSGDGRRAVVPLITLVRWTAWTPAIFYTQILRSAVASFAQAAANPSSKHANLWRAFIVGRLPRLLLMFEKSPDMDSISEIDWRLAMHVAVSSLPQQAEQLTRCDTVYQQNSTDPMSSHIRSPVGPFLLELLHQLSALGLVDSATVASLCPNLPNEFHPKMQSEAQEHGSELEPYLESRLASDTNVEDASSIVEKICRDPCSHAAFAAVVQKRFKTYPSSYDLESLGHLCHILCAHEHLLDTLTLHVRIQDLLAHALLIVEDYDCETVGDPQAAVTHYGNIVLFLQLALAKYHLAGAKFTVGDRTLTCNTLESASVTFKIDGMTGEDKTLFSSWQKALFDKGNEGIDDSILRSTRPRSLLRIAATLLSHSIVQCAERKLDKDTLIMGLSFFSGPLLNWTLVGVVAAILKDIQRKGFFPPMILHIETLQTLLQSPACPAPVPRLSAPLMLRILPTTKLQPSPAAVARGAVPLDPLPLRKLALQALGSNAEDARNSLVMHSTHVDPVTHAIADAVASAQAGKAPALDVDRCLLFTTPTKFLTSLWAQLSIQSTTGDLEAPRRIATFVLSMPRSPRSPPLLPIFLHAILPSIITAADHLTPADQPLAVELIVGVISSALAAALFVDAALLSVEKQKEKRLVLGQPALTMARRLSGELKRRARSQTSKMVMQRLTSSTSFMANFPTFTTEL